MNKLYTFMRLAIVAILMITSFASPAFAAPAEVHRASRVIVVLAPYLTWDDVTPSGMPNTWALADSGAVGDINARSRTRQAGEPPSPLEGPLTISAGLWAVPDFTAVAAYSSDEAYEYGSAGEAFERVTGMNTEGRSIVYLGMPVVSRRNLARSAEIKLGILGQTIEDAGGVTAALGNSDVGYATGEQRKVRPAALAAMNATGGVWLGDVSQRLIREDPDAPFGIRTDLSAFENKLDELYAATAAQNGASLLVLDPGDVYRAVKFAPQVAESVAELHYENSLRTLDAVVGYAMKRATPDDMIVVVSQSSSDSSGYEGLGPLIISGASFRGVLSSSSTHRQGIVTNLDVTATVLDSLGLSRPVSVLGNPMFTEQRELSTEERIDFLEEANRAAIAIDSSKASIIKTYIAITVAALVLSTLLLLRNHSLTASRKMRALRTALKSVLLGVLAFPLATFAMFIVLPRPDSGAQATIVVVLLTLALWGVAQLVHRTRGIRVAIAVMSLGISALLLIDQLLGAPLSFSAYLGYSPLLAARFYGIGNEGAAIMFGATLIGFAALLDQLRGTKAAKFVANVAFPASAILSTVVMAAPLWGANVAVAVWGVAGYGLAWLLFTDRRVTWKVAIAAIAAVFALLATFIVVDFVTPGPQTHLARSLESAFEGGVGELWTIVARKAQTNLRVLTHTNWSFVLIAVLGFLGLMRWRPAGDFAQTLSDNPALGAAITASLFGGAVAYFTEDSGIVIPALIFLYVGVAIVGTMLDRMGEPSDGDGEGTC